MNSIRFIRTDRDPTNPVEPPYSKDPRDHWSEQSLSAEVPRDPGANSSEYHKLNGYWWEKSSSIEKTIDDSSYELIANEIADKLGDGPLATLALKLASMGSVKDFYLFLKDIIIDLSDKLSKGDLAGLECYISFVVWFFRTIFGVPSVYTIYKIFIKVSKWIYKYFSTD